MINKTDIQKYICNVECTVMQVMQELSLNDTRIVFLTDVSNKLFGCITDGDIRRYLLAGGSLEDSALGAANKNPKIAKSFFEARQLHDKKNYIVIPIVDESGTVTDLYTGDEESKKLLLIGGGGHCRSVVDSIISLKMYSKLGIVDYEESPVLGIPVVGNDENLPQLFKDGWNDAFVTVGSIGNTSTRHRIFDVIKTIGFHVPTFIDPSAVVARNVKIGEGCFVGKNATVNTGSWIGSGAIINTGSIIEHDCVVGDFCHVSPGAIVCGGVSVGNNTHIGAGSVVIQQIRIGSNAIIGAGSVVVKDIPDNVKAYGNPCKVVGK